MNSDDDFFDSQRKDLNVILPSTSQQTIMTRKRCDSNYQKYNKFSPNFSTNKRPKRFYRPVFTLTLTIVLIFFVKFGQALHNNLPTPTDPSILAVFRDLYDGKEVEFEKMVKFF